MRLLIHYLGDIAQPLHCATKVDKQTPKGDRGGNNFELPKKNFVDNLHSLWDSVIYEFQSYYTLPFSDSDWSKIESNVKTLTSKYQISSSEYQNTNYMKWATDAYNIGAQNAWEGISENTVVSTSYINRVKPLAERQIVLGGYRLAYLIQQLFGVSAEEESIDII